MLTPFYWRVPNAAGGLYLWCQDDLPNTFAWVVSICGARMTCLTNLYEWCLSVVLGWPAQHICMSGVYLWCQDDLPNTFAWVVSMVPGWPAQQICMSGVYLWCQDDLLNTFASVVSIHPYIHPVNGNGNHFLLVCQTTHKSTNIYQARTNHIGVKA